MRLKERLFPPVSTRENHEGANAVAAVFQTVAVVVLGIGLVSAVAVGEYVHKHMSDSVGKSIAYAIVVALSGVLLASMLAFFGYVLDLLAEIAENTRSREENG
jgi:flagellar motor component MotA